jgi:hypothetical protein
MQSLSKSDEQQLLDGVKQAVDLVDNAGLSPNAALQKVAEEMNYSPGFLKAACNAFNNGRQLAQWKANDNILDKLASFPLANYEEIHGSMWGDTQEKAASASSLVPQFTSYDDQARQELLNMDLSSFTKVASEVSPSVPAFDEYQDERRVKLAYNKVEFQRRQVEAARQEKVAAEDKLWLKMHLLESYFKKFAYDRLPLAQVENAAATYYGTPGRALMGYVAEKFPREKRASDHAKTWEGFQQPVDRKAEPFTLISECIKQAQVLNSMQGFLAQETEKLAEYEGEYYSFTQLRSPSRNSSRSILTPSLIGDSEKEANLLSGATGGFTFGFGKSVADAMGEQAKQRVESQIEDLDDPSHLNELRKIRAQTMLTQMMSDPENPLSGYEPENVMQAYNELVQLTPRLADQPAALMPLLNRRLVGNTEPFEVQEALKLEEGLQKTQPSSIAKKISNEASILS